MSIFKVHTKETAPGGSTPLLGDAEKTFGFIPNLLGVFAESPAALEANLAVWQIFDESSFSPTERQVVELAASRFNECRYCVAAHSVVAGMQQVPADVIEALRNDRPIDDNKLQALRVFTTEVVEARGWVSEDQVGAFLAAGYNKAQVLEVILGITFKTLSNYANHIADTPLDTAFAAQAWTPAISRLAS